MKPQELILQIEAKKRAEEIIRGDERRKISKQIFKEIDSWKIIKCCCSNCEKKYKEIKKKWLK